MNKKIYIYKNRQSRNGRRIGRPPYKNHQWNEVQDLQMLQPIENTEENTEDTEEIEKNTDNFWILNYDLIFLHLLNFENLYLRRDSLFPAA
tara:strand:+ start:511 stop:783 length:273 start_codon:yes stop_codon:yes gene_type:complete